MPTHLGSRRCEAALSKKKKREDEAWEIEREARFRNLPKHVQERLLKEDNDAMIAWEYGAFNP